MTNISLAKKVEVLKLITLSSFSGKDISAQIKIVVNEQ